MDRRDPLLSPYHAKKENLPPWIYMIAAEWDMLRLEGQIMMHELAGVNVEMKGAEHPVDFECGRYKWTLARGCTHGFTHHFGMSRAARERREGKCVPLYDEAGVWLGKALGEVEGVEE